MDYDKLFKEKQKEFLNNPRESIKSLVENSRKWLEGLVELSKKQERPDRLIWFNEFHKEYSSLVGVLLKNRPARPGSFKDDEEIILLLQRFKEIKSVIEDYEGGAKPPEVSALALGRMYASALEMYWHKLKKIVFLFGLNSKEKHLNVNELLGKICELEKKYNLDLKNLKSMLESKLRNSVGHENTRFKTPNIVVFSTREGDKIKEVSRLTTEEICEFLVRFTTINTALHHVEQTVIISWLEQLLELSDKELSEYCKTGKLTPEMEKKILDSWNEKKNSK